MLFNSLAGDEGLGTCPGYTENDTKRIVDLQGAACLPFPRKPLHGEESAPYIQK